MGGNLTPNGVCYDLRSTPFTTQYKGITFHFSSVIHKQKFDSKIQMREDWLTDSLTRRFKFKIDASIIALFQLYIQIETRGFLVIVDGRVYESKEELCLSGILSD